MQIKQWVKLEGDFTKDGSRRVKRGYSGRRLRNSYLCYESAKKFYATSDRNGHERSECLYAGTSCIKLALEYHSKLYAEVQQDRNSDLGRCVIGR